MENQTGDTKTEAQSDNDRAMAIHISKIAERIGKSSGSYRNIPITSKDELAGFQIFEEGQNRCVQYLMDIEKQISNGKNFNDAFDNIRKKYEESFYYKSSGVNYTLSTYDSVKKEDKKISTPVEEVTLFTPPDLSLADLNILYLRAIEALQQGRYREMFSIFKPCLAFHANNPFAWFRISEACILEFYEESFEFADTYRRLFGKNGRLHITSPRRQINELRPRHPDMTLRYTEYVTLMAFTMARYSKQRYLQFVAAKNWTFLMLKMKRYREALETISYIFLKTAKRPMSCTEMSHIFLFKAEAMLFTGNTNRSIEYSIKACEMSNERRLRSRAMMFAAMGYAKKNNYTKACDIIQDLMRFEILEVCLLENVILFGLHMAYKMNNVEMLQLFIKLLQEAVY